MDDIDLMVEETTDFATLKWWYEDASDRADYAEFVLLVYHHLMCLYEADLIRAWEANRDGAQRYTAMKKEVSEAIEEQTTVLERRFGRKLPSLVMPSEGQVTKDPRHPADTAKSMYRWNHVADWTWVTMDYRQRQEWIRSMQEANPGKTIIS